MTDEAYRDRARREREVHNDGLQQRPYSGVLNQSRHWFAKRRRQRSAEIIGRYESPRVLELGSQSWYSFFEQNGLLVQDLTCINVSEVELQKGEDLARNTRNKPRFELGDAQDLNYEDNCFDVVFGASILHHLDFERALKEIRRVLKPDGTMFFFEPLGMNPVGRLVRQLTPKARTEDERPFRMEEFRTLQQHFDCNFEFQEMLSVPVGVLTALGGASPENRIGRAAYGLDRVLGRVPGLKFWCRTVFLEGMPKPESTHRSVEAGGA